MTGFFLVEAVGAPVVGTIGGVLMSGVVLTCGNVGGSIGMMS